MSQLSIEDFKGALSNGGIRPTMFEVVVSLPTDNIVLDNTEFETDLRQIRFLGKAAAIPGEVITTVSVGLPAGGNLKLPGSRLFEPWALTIINDGQMRLREMFELWMRSINNYSNQLSVQELDKFMAPVQVIQLDRAGEPVRYYNLEYCYPTNIDAQELSFEATDQISDFTVTFNYHYCEPEGVLGGKRTKYESDKETARQAAIRARETE